MSVNLTQGVPVGVGARTECQLHSQPQTSTCPQVLFVEEEEEALRGQKQGNLVFASHPASPEWGPETQVLGPDLGVHKASFPFGVGSEWVR